MMGAIARRYSALPTAAKLLLILTAALLPIGIGLTGVAQQGIGEASSALRDSAADRSSSAARAIESLLARNALALRVAANGALAGGADGACERAQRSLSIAPAVARGFQFDSTEGTPLCSVGAAERQGDLPLVAPGDIRLRVAPDGRSLILRVGVVGGMATAPVPLDELRRAAEERSRGIESISIVDGSRTLGVLGPTQRPDPNLDHASSDWPIGNGQLMARIGTIVPRITTTDRLLLLLPLLMWVTAALISWLLVTRLLIRPLRRLERAALSLQPGESANLPDKLGPATEIQQLREAFARTLARIELSEREMAEALDGQRRLVREVHHRVKNNLQVIASLLNIHGRSADSVEARAAYAAIGRRVGALSIVHRNHFAEMEENRGLALRPLITELAAELRAGSPDSARGLSIELELDSVNTTQDVAVSAAFLVTEMVEYAMLRQPLDAVEVAIRRTSELTARLTLASPVLVPDDAGRADKVQFERIMSGLAKQLRSGLDRKLGRYSVDLPVFPSF